MATALLDRPAPIHDDATRRRFLIGGASLVALLAGCGSDDSAPDAQAGDGGFPVTIDGAFGPTRIDRRPERVVAAGFLRDGDDALALGVTPVAMATSGNFPEPGLAPWTLQALGSAKPTIFDVTDGLPFERIAAARPDLILATDDRTLADHHDRLAGIAPVLAYTTGAETDPWQQRAERIGRALGRTQQAAEVARRVEQMIRSAREQHPEFEGKTVVSGPVVEGKIYVVNRESDASAALQSELGLKLSPQVAALPESFPGRAEISPERIELLEADVIMLSYVSPSDRQLVESSELFRRLEAVRRGSYIDLDLGVGISRGYPSLLSIPYSLERTVPLIAEALAA
ncbi:MAG: iron-siderophore ABC transporter substrate-binding protein [Actinomycetota bacterium]|nr:iron-siderophore ABC transporter substrate-binding protein [Actinomycetota bacterium]